MDTQINLEGLISYLGNCCLGIESCNTCTKENCLIGYSKKNLMTFLKSQNQFIDGGIAGIPYRDTKLYDDNSITEAIGFLLGECRNCNLYHDEECIINIVRSALEIIILGEAQEYKGSALVYLNDVKNTNKEISDRILASYQKTKK